MNISPVHGSAGFWISSSCSIPVFFVGPIPMSAGKTKKTMCFNLFVFLHYASPSSERLCDKKIQHILYLQISVGFLQGPPFQPSYRPCRHQHPQPWCRCHLPASASWKSYEIMAGGCRWSSNQTWQWKSGKVNKYNGY